MRDLKAEVAAAWVASLAAEAEAEAEAAWVAAREATKQRAERKLKGLSPLEGAAREAAVAWEAWAVTLKNLILNKN